MVGHGNALTRLVGQFESLIRDRPAQPPEVGSDVILSNQPPLTSSPQNIAFNASALETKVDRILTQLANVAVPAPQPFVTPSVPAPVLTQANDDLQTHDEGIKALIANLKGQLEATEEKLSEAIQGRVVDNGSAALSAQLTAHDGDVKDQIVNNGSTVLSALTAQLTAHGVDVKNQIVDNGSMVLGALKAQLTTHDGDVKKQIAELKKCIDALSKPQLTDVSHAPPPSANVDDISENIIDQSEPLNQPSNILKEHEERIKALQIANDGLQSQCQKLIDAYRQCRENAQKVTEERDEYLALVRTYGDHIDTNTTRFGELTNNAGVVQRGQAQAIEAVRQVGTNISNGMSSITNVMTECLRRVDWLTQVFPDDESSKQLQEDMRSIVAAVKQSDPGELADDGQGVSELVENAMHTSQIVPTDAQGSVAESEVERVKDEIVEYLKQAKAHLDETKDKYQAMVTVEKVITTTEVDSALARIQSNVLQIVKVFGPHDDPQVEVVYEVKLRDLAAAIGEDQFKYVVHAYNRLPENATRMIKYMDDRNDDIQAERDMTVEDGSDEQASPTSPRNDDDGMSTDDKTTVQASPTLPQIEPSISTPPVSAPQPSDGGDEFRGDTAASIHARDARVNKIDSKRRKLNSLGIASGQISKVVHPRSNSPPRLPQTTSALVTNFTNSDTAGAPDSMDTDDTANALKLRTRKAERAAKQMHEDINKPNVAKALGRTRGSTAKHNQ
jgi:uncharacterized coiled-coil DUF342 family protein